MKVEVAAGEAIYSGFANGGSPGRLPEGAPPAKNVANTNVGIFDDHLIVYFEGGLPHGCTRRPSTPLAPTTSTAASTSCAPRTSRSTRTTGDMLFFAATGPTITWYRADVKTGQIIDSHTFDIGVPVLMHDFVVSEHLRHLLRHPRPVPARPGRCRAGPGWSGTKTRPGTASRSS